MCSVLVDGMLESVQVSLKIPEKTFCPSCFSSDSSGKVYKCAFKTYYVHLYRIFSGPPLSLNSVFPLSLPAYLQDSVSAACHLNQCLNGFSEKLYSNLYIH